MSKLSDYIARAERLEADGHDEEALAAWREAAGVGANAEGLLVLARACLRLGRAAEGEGLLQRIIRETPNDSLPHFLLGSYYHDIDRLEDARESLERSAGLEASAPTLIVLGIVYRRLDDIVSARACFERALLLEPDNSEAFYNLAVTYSFVDNEKATELFRCAVAADPEDGPAHRELGHMLWRAGLQQQAEGHLRTALRIDSEDAWAHDYLGSLLLLRDSLDDAECEFRAAVDLWPNLPLFHCHLGDALAHQRRLFDAEAAYLRALALDTNYYLANLRYGELLKEQGRLSKARLYVERALHANPSDRRARATLEALRRALRENPESA